MLRANMYLRQYNFRDAIGWGDSEGFVRLAMDAVSQMLLSQFYQYYLRSATEKECLCLCLCSFRKSPPRAAYASQASAPRSPSSEPVPILRYPAGITASTSRLTPSLMSRQTSPTISTTQRTLNSSVSRTACHVASSTTPSKRQGLAVVVSTWT